MRKLFLTLFLVLLAFPAHASEFPINTANSSITGTVRYTLIGKYVAFFDRYEGSITTDEAGRIKSVVLSIDASSVRSNFSTLDNIVRSPKLLDTKKFPAIVFQGSTVTEGDGEFKVRGILMMHGVTREVEFPFDAEVTKEGITASGHWPIARKEFDVIWNKFLDQGGVVVGNMITVDWEINAKNEPA